MSNIKLNFENIKPFDTAQAWSEATGFSYYMIRDLCIKGEIPYIITGKSKRLICKQGFIEYLENKMQENSDNE